VDLDIPVLTELLDRRSRHSSFNWIVRSMYPQTDVYVNMC